MSKVVEKSLPLNVLNVNEFQPEERTAEPSLRGLKSEIEQSGYIVPVHVVDDGDGTYTVADGHRRIAVARLLGHTHIPCVIHSDETDARELFMRLNKETRKMSAREWFIVWSQSTNKATALKRFPKGVARNIEAIKTWIGEAETVKLARARISPGIAVAVNKIDNLSYRHSGTVPVTVAEILFWLVKHKQQNDVNRTLSEAGTNRAHVLRKMFERISADEPLVVHVRQGRRKAA